MSTSNHVPEELRATQPLSLEKIRRIIRDVDPFDPMPMEELLPTWAELLSNTVGYDWHQIKDAMTAASLEEDDDKREVLHREAMRLIHGGQLYAEVLEYDLAAILARAVPVYREAQEIIRAHKNKTRRR